MKVDVLAAVLGCRVHHLPITYLGLPLRPIPNVKAPRQLWNQAVEHLERMTVCWTRKYLLMGGRLILIKSTWSDLPVSFMYFLVLPAWVWNPFS